MNGKRQHLEHEKICSSSQPHLQDLRDAIESIDKDKWTIDTAMDKLDKEELERLKLVINSLVEPYKVMTPLEQ